MLVSWFVASKSDWYLGFELVLIDALGQKHVEVQALLDLIAGSG